MRWCTFLDFEIFKSDPNGPGILKFKPYVKPTARHIPLASDSYHPWGVHKSWPVAEMLGMSRRSSDVHLARAWQQAKIRKFLHFFIDARVVQVCKDWQPCVPSDVAKCCLGVFVWSALRRRPSGSSCHTGGSLLDLCECLRHCAKSSGRLSKSRRADP